MEVSEITKEIYQDSKNKYLVIQNDIQGQDSLAVNMLKNNDIDGFLRFECRCIDNTEFFYYDITGMTNLSELSKSETFDIKQLKNQFQKQKNEIIHYHLIIIIKTEAAYEILLSRLF